jgi:hypothetical protein
MSLYGHGQVSSFLGRRAIRRKPQRNHQAQAGLIQVRQRRLDWRWRIKITKSQPGQPVCAGVPLLRLPGDDPVSQILCQRQDLYALTLHLSGTAIKIPEVPNRLLQKERDTRTHRYC